MYLAAPRYLARILGRGAFCSAGWSSGMSNLPKGEFSANFFTLQLQLKHMLEGVGGDATVELLDALAKLTGSEQKVVLKVFSNVIERITKGDQRLVSEVDKALNDFEETLYRDVVAGMSEAAASPSDGAPKLEVLPGGKHPVVAKAPLDLEKARKSRKLGLKPIFN